MKTLERRRSAPLLLGGGAAIGIVVVAAIIFALSQGAPATSIDAGPVAALQQSGVTHVEKAGAFVVWTGSEFLALSERDPHIGEHIKYCQTSGWFEEPLHGDKFDIEGNYRLGPAPRGMARFAFKIRNGDLYIETSNAAKGPPRGSGPATRLKGPFCVATGGRGGERYLYP